MYIIKLDDIGYFRYDSRYKPVSKELAQVIEKYKKADEIAVKLRKLGYRTQIENATTGS